MKYNKESKEGKRLYFGGPRDMQRKHKLEREKEVFIRDLQQEIKNLTTALEEKQRQARTDQIYTQEQLDKEINDAVIQALEKNRDSNLGTIEKLKLQIDNLTGKLEDKETLIESLKTDRFDGSDEYKELLHALKTGRFESVKFEEDDDRPKIEEVFIDPTDEKYKDSLKTHIEVEEVSDSEVDVDRQLKKLRKLLKK